MGTSVGLHQPESAAVPICWGIGSQTPSFTESLHLTPFYLVADATNLTVNQKLQVKKKSVCESQEEGSFSCNASDDSYTKPEDRKTTRA